ncbi:hypothetical protein TNIN_271891 [Trichonephila inaurata madagascariensis]|uniref:Uncharacterized protein n=1 Tax=Trichonephila inaurata madagascariensis TaxID=2747483 RepID=A0A8X6XEI3_9ARAC|nr:hypothetical protein TNIN_271891 [Trichonephila inaurata madagascariensis]
MSYLELQQAIQAIHLKKLFCFSPSSQKWENNVKLPCETSPVINTNGETSPVTDINGETFPMIDTNGETFPMIDTNGEASPVMDTNGETSSVIDTNAVTSPVIDISGETDSNDTSLSEATVIYEEESIPDRFIRNSQ